MINIFLYRQQHCNLAFDSAFCKRFTAFHFQKICSDNDAYFKFTRFDLALHAAHKALQCTKIIAKQGVYSFPFINQ